MTYTVYIIYSAILNKYYTGYTSKGMEERMHYHLGTHGGYTSRAKDWAPKGKYHFTRYRLETELAAKRKIIGQLTWWFRSFYGGNLRELEASLKLNPSSSINFELVGTHNIGRLPVGNFDQTLLGFRVRFNVSADLQLNSFVQDDTDSNTVGINARIHLTYHPQGDLFLVF